MNTNHSLHAPSLPGRTPNQLYAPNGQFIIASKDWIPGNALIQGATRLPDGTLEIEWDGETKICWDGQYTEQLGDQRIFLDEDANEWREDQLTLGSEAHPVEPPPSAMKIDPWAGIPDYALGEGPDSLPGQNPILCRRIIAKRALLAGYEASDEPEQCLTDLLGDLRHLCDGLALDFAKIDRAAYQRYAEGKSTPSA
jgi:hypothetical protein